jgi:hypothetical protein
MYRRRTNKAEKVLSACRIIVGFRGADLRHQLAKAKLGLSRLLDRETQSENRLFASVGDVHLPFLTGWIVAALVPENSACGCNRLIADRRLSAQVVPSSSTRNSPSITLKK